ncbi:hypothetical protein VPH35_006273 [Triticum aestivum]
MRAPSGWSSSAWTGAIMMTMIMMTMIVSPETAEWSEQCPGLHLTADPFIVNQLPPVLVGNAFHFMLVHDDLRVGILKYDLGSNCLSLIDGPPPEGFTICPTAVLMAMADGSLGFAHVDSLTLCLWSRHTGSDGAASWAERAIIDLKNHLPIQNPGIRLRPTGSVEGSDIIFVTTDLGIYEINLKSLQWKKLWKRENVRYFFALIPYMSFYTPQGLQNDGDRKKLPEGTSALQQTAVRAHDAVGAAPAGGLPRITEAGEEDLEI